METDFSEQVGNIKQSAQKDIDRLEGELAVAKNANNLLRDEFDKASSVTSSRLTTLEREAYRTAEYINYESVEISKIPLTIPDNEIPEVTLNIINALGSRGDEELTLDDVHAIHRRQGQYTKEKVLVKFVRRGRLGSFERSS